MKGSLKCEKAVSRDKCGTDGLRKKKEASGIFLRN